MISLALAQTLKTAGLHWTPQLHDFFALPLPGLDERVFVLGDMLADTEIQAGEAVVTFNGSSEWALDYVVTHAVVWLPSEGQLRKALEQRLYGGAQPAVQLACQPSMYTCTLQLASGEQAFQAESAEDAYGLALLHLLQS